MRAVRCQGQNLLPFNPSFNRRTNGFHGDRRGSQQPMQWHDGIVKI